MILNIILEETSTRIDPTTVIAIVSIIISIGALVTQRIHNMNSVKPLLEIITYDYENMIMVVLKNSGVGPAIIKYSKCQKNDEIKKGIVNFLEDTDIVFDNFIEELDSRIVSPGQELILLEYEIIEYSQEIDPKGILLKIEFDKIKEIREEIKDINLKISYNNIYKHKFELVKNLKYYAR